MIFRAAQSSNIILGQDFHLMQNYIVVELLYIISSELMQTYDSSRKTLSYSRPMLKSHSEFYHIRMPLTYSRPRLKSYAEFYSRRKHLSYLKASLKSYAEFYSMRKHLSYLKARHKTYAECNGSRTP